MNAVTSVDNYLARLDCTCTSLLYPPRYASPEALEIDMKRDSDRDTVSRRWVFRITSAAAVWGAGFILSPGQAKSASARVIAIDIRNRKVPAIRHGTVRVTEGDDVRIDWTTDEATDLHLHGYDIETRVAPGRAASMTFRAHTAGRFPVSAHNFGHRILLYLEVYPR